MLFFGNTWFGKLKTLIVILILKINLKNPELQSAQVFLLSSLAYSDKWSANRPTFSQLHQLKITLLSSSWVAAQLLAVLHGSHALTGDLLLVGSPLPWSVSLCLHLLSLSQLHGCESCTSTALISWELGGRQCTASTNVAGAKGFSPRKSLWNFFDASPWSSHQTMCLHCPPSCNHQLDEGQACSYGPSEDMAPFPACAASFSQWGCKHPIPFCTLVLIYVR